MKPALGIIGLLAGGLTALPADPAFAQEPASSPSELRQIIKVDEGAIIVTTDGHRLTGSVEAVTDTALIIRMKSGTEVLSFERVEEVIVRRHDPLWNGILIGMGIGAVAGLIPDYYDDCEECHDSLYGSIAFGAGVGLLVDALIRSRRVVYRAPETGARISLDWQITSRRTGMALRLSF